MKQRSNRKFEANEAADTPRGISSNPGGGQPGGLADDIFYIEKIICYPSRRVPPPGVGIHPGGIGRFIRLKLPITSLLHSFIPSFT